MAARDFSLPPPAVSAPQGSSAELHSWLQLVLHIGTAARALRRRLALLIAPSQLSEQEFLVLWLVSDAALPQRGQGELAEAMGVSPAQMSGLVERLRARDLLQFERSGSDRRRQVWLLTAAGNNLLAEVCQRLTEFNGRLAGGLTAAELAQLRSLLERWLPCPLSTSEQGGRSSCAA